MTSQQQTMYLSSYVPAEAEFSWAVAPYDTKKHWVPQPQFASPLNGLGQFNIGGGLAVMVLGGAGILLLLHLMNKKPARRRVGR